MIANVPQLLPVEKAIAPETEHERQQDGRGPRPHEAGHVLAGPELLRHLSQRHGQQQHEGHARQLPRPRAGSHC